jgi:stage II sporulation protein D
MLSNFKAKNVFLRKELPMKFKLILLLTTLLLTTLLYYLGTASPISHVSPIGKTICFSDDTGSTSMDMEEFLPLCVMGIWDIQENEELLKLQFVLMRTWLLYCFNEDDTLTYEELTNRSQTAISYMTKQLQEKWGSGYTENYNHLIWLQSQTGHKVITCEDAVILPFFHKLSGGHTAGTATVYGDTYPYITSVDSSWDLSESGAMQTQVLNFSDFLSTLEESYPDTGLSAENFYDSFSLTTEEESGYVTEVTLGTQILSGVEFARIFNLQSTCFTLSKATDTKENAIRLIAKGIGDGLGVSLYGAKHLAKNGFTWEEILNHYYKNIEIREQ